MYQPICKNNMNNMNIKIVSVAIAALIGAGLGAYLGFGKLQKYKSEGVININMGASEYKRITDVVNDASKMLKFSSNNLPAKMPETLFQSNIAAVVMTEWHKPIPRISKQDIKELPDVVVKIERDYENDKDKDLISKPSSAYTGVRVTSIASDPTQAMQVATWLGGYFREMAALVTVRDLVNNWKDKNRQYLDNSNEQKLRLEFEMEQAQMRLAALRKIVTKYPDTVLREGSQAVGVRKETERFLSPMAMLFSAESQIIDVNEKFQKLSYQTEQQLFIKPLLTQAESILNQSITGEEILKQISKLTTEYLYKTRTNAEKEKIILFGAELSQIKYKYVEPPIFLSLPNLPTRAEGGSPFKLIILMSLLFALITSSFVWRQNIIKFIQSNDEPLAATK